MTAGLKSYDSNQVDVFIDDIPINSGRADGTFLKIEWEADRFTMKVGADGEVSRSKTNNKAATATLTIMQTSESNAALSALATLDDLAPNGAGVGPFLVKDRSGASIHTAAACWVARSPDPEYGAEAGTREWKISIASLDSVDGGN